MIWRRLLVVRLAEPIPTKQEIDRKEAQTRKLMLLDKDARAKVLAAMQAEEVEVKRERERLEAIRIHRAATGVYECLLELKQPVAAAEAARMRLAMCDDGFDDDNGDLGTGSNTRLQVSRGSYVPSDAALRYSRNISDKNFSRGTFERLLRV